MTPTKIDTLSNAATEFKITGAWLAVKAMLVHAIRDRRVRRSHLHVLASIATVMDPVTAKSKPTKATLAGMCGVSTKTISNLISELKRMGYILSELLADEGEAHYVFNMDHDAVREEITAFVNAVRSSNHSREYGNVPENSGTLPSTTVPENTGNIPETRESKDVSNSREHGKLPENPGKSAPVNSGKSREPGKPKSATHILDSNTKKLSNNNIPTTCARTREGASTRERATRLPDDWRLPRPWGVWALDTFDVTVEDVRREAETFKNHWLATAGAKARKLDWHRTWQNWCGSDIRKWKRKRKASSEHAPDLPSKKSGRERLEENIRLGEALKL